MASATHTRTPSLQLEQEERSEGIHGLIISIAIGFALALTISAVVQIMDPARAEANGASLSLLGKSDELATPSQTAQAPSASVTRSTHAGLNSTRHQKPTTGANL